MQIILHSALVSHYSFFLRTLTASTPSIRWQYSIRHGVLSDTLPASIENPDSGTVPTLGPDYRAAIYAKADLRTFTWGNGVDRTEDDALNEPLSISAAATLDIIETWRVDDTRFLRLYGYVRSIHIYTSTTPIYRIAKILARQNHFQNHTESQSCRLSKRMER